MDKELEKRKLRAGAFMINNGMVLTYANLLRERYNPLRNIEKCLKKDGVSQREFIDSVNFLMQAGYITLREINSKQAAGMADYDYTELEALVTEKGIRLLAGGILDDMIDLGD